MYKFVNVYIHKCVNTQRFITLCVYTFTQNVCHKLEGS